MPLATVGVLGALAALFFAPGIFYGEAPIFRDLLVLVIPLRSFASHAIGAGTLPLWTDDLFFGAPFLANYQSAVFYPPSAIVYLLPLPLGLSLFLAFHLLVAGWGMTRYLERRCGLEPMPALFGGLVFAFGGFMISLVPLTNQLEVAAWLPWVLDAGEDLLSSGRWRSFFALTVLCALQALGGGPEAQLLTLLVLFAALLREPIRMVQAKRRVLAIGAAVALGLLLCAVQLVPTAEYAATTDRLAGLDLERVADESFSLRSLMQLLLPHVFYDGGPSFVPEGGVPFLWSIYVGVVPFALALPLLVSRAGGSWALLFWISLVLSLGASTAVFPALYGLAPRIVGAFRFPSKFFLVADFVLALFAARQLSSVLLDKHARRTVLGLLCVITVLGLAIAVAAPVAPALALRFAGYVVPPDLGDAAQRLLASRLSLLALRGGALAIIGAALLWQLERGRMRPTVAGLVFVGLTTLDLVGIHRPTVVFAPWHTLLESTLADGGELAPGERIFHYATNEDRGLLPWSGGLLPGESVERQANDLWAAMIPDVPMMYGLGAVAGSDGFATRDQRAFFAAMAGLPRDRSIHLLQALGVVSLIGRTPLAAPPGTRFVASAAPWRYQLPEPAPRTYFAERLFTATDVRSALERAAAPDFRPGRDAVVLESAGAVEPAPSIGEARGISARAGALGADVTIAGNGFWVVSDTWFPGWRATIDGQPAEILRVNGFLRGIRLPAGNHRVEMHYQPDSFRLGVLVSLAAAVVFLACGIYAIASRRRH